VVASSLIPASSLVRKKDEAAN